MPRRRPVVYKIPKTKPSIALGDFSTGARDAAVYADTARRKADKGECDGALSAYSDAAQAFGRADAQANDRAEKAQLDSVLWPKLQSARAAIGKCYRGKR